MSRRSIPALVVLAIALTASRAHAEEGDLLPSEGPAFSIGPNFVTSFPSLSRTTYRGLVDVGGVPSSHAYSGQELGLSHPTTFGFGLSAHLAPFTKARWFSLFADGWVAGGRVDSTPTNAAAFDSIARNPATNNYKSPYVGGFAIGPEVQAITGLAIFRAGIGFGVAATGLGDVHATSFLVQPRVGVDFIIVSTSSSFGTYGQKPVDDRALTIGLTASADLGVTKSWTFTLGPGFSFF